MQSQMLTWLVRAIVLFTAMPIHECAHGYVAYKLGDNTARYQGRLTLNPLSHLDPIGGILLVVAGFGWAKPVPINPRNFKNPKRDTALSSLAGPVSNILLALVVMIIYKLLVYVPAFRYLPINTMVFFMLYNMIMVNLYLAVFNFLPIPPLDGGKIFGAILPDKYYFFMLQYERYVSIVLFILIFAGVLSRPLMWVASYLYRLLDLITLPITLLA